MHKCNSTKTLTAFSAFLTVRESKAAQNSNCWLDRLRPARFIGSIENPASEKETGTFLLRRLRKNEPVPGGVFYSARVIRF